MKVREQCERCMNLKSEWVDCYDGSEWHVYEKHFCWYDWMDVYDDLEKECDHYERRRR